MLHIFFNHCHYDYLIIIICLYWYRLTNIFYFLCAFYRWICSCKPLDVAVWFIFTQDPAPHCTLQEFGLPGTTIKAKMKFSSDCLPHLTLKTVTQWRWLITAETRCWTWGWCARFLEVCSSRFLWKGTMYNVLIRDCNISDSERNKVLSWQYSCCNSI